MTLDENRQRLFDIACRRLVAWTKPAVFKSIGPFDPLPFDAFDAERTACTARAREKLTVYSDEQISALLDGATDKALDTRKDWQNFVNLEIDQLLRRMPAWYAAGFGHPDHVADFDHWAKMSSFSVGELLCLSVGIEPDRFPKLELLKLQLEPMEKLHPTLRFFLRRLDQLQRRFGTITDDMPIRPRDFVSWANRVQFEAPEDFIRLIETYHPDRQSSFNTGAQTKKADRREIDKVAQILTAMAIDGYGYVPDQDRSPLPREIADLMAGLGLQATDDTVRKYLRLGASFLPKDWKPTKG